MRLLLLGAGGQLGTAFKYIAESHPRVSEVIAAGRSHADVTRPAETERLLRATCPDAVINGAAFMSADRCQEEPDRAYEVNTLGARSVARAAAAVRARCVYIGTELVFDGRKESHYDESDVPNPLLTYGISKLAGELETRCADSRHLVVRTSALFGPRPESQRARLGFVDRILDRAGAGEQLRIVDNVLISPTYTVDLSKMIVELLAADAEGGTYHVANDGSTTWFGLASAALVSAGVDAAIEPSSADGGYAPRPPSAPLASRRLPAAVVQLNRHWTDALEHHFQSPEGPK